MTNSKKKHPCLSLNYIKILRWLAWFTGSWPGEVFSDDLPLIFRAHRVALPALAMIVCIGICFYGINEYNRNKLTLFILGNIFLTSFICVITSIRITLAQLKEYGAITKFFLEEFHLMNITNKGENAKRVFLLMEKLSYYMAILEGIFVASAVILLNIGIFYNNLKKGAFSGREDLNITREYSVSFDFPGYNHQDHFYITTIWCLYFAYNASTSLCCLDLLMLLMVFQIIGHLMILKSSIENGIRPMNSITIKMESNNNYFRTFATVQIFNDEENRHVHSHLVQIIYHHTKIISFSDRVSTFFGPMLAINYCFALLAGCLILLEVSSPVPGAAVRYVPMGICIFGELILVSPIFEVVHSVSEKLIDAVYSMPWECMDVRNQKTVLFLLARVQIPLQVTAMGIVPVGVTTMLGILKTTFSYYAMLKTLE